MTDKVQQIAIDTLEQMFDYSTGCLFKFAKGDHLKESRPVPPKDQFVNVTEMKNKYCKRCVNWRGAECALNKNLGYTACDYNSDYRFFEKG